MSNPDEKLTKALTEISPQDASIDTFSDFPTKEAVDIQVFNRMLSETMELDYYKQEADFVAEIMRAFNRQSRREVVLSLYKDIAMYNQMVDPHGAEREEKNEDR